MSEEIPHHHYPQCAGMHGSDQGTATWEIFFEMCRELAETARRRQAKRLAQCNEASAQDVTPQETV